MSQIAFANLAPFVTTPCGPALKQAKAPGLGDSPVSRALSFR
jgi:hypothetical protein